MSNTTGKGFHKGECKGQGCLEHAEMTYKKGPEVAKSAKIAYIKKAESAEGLPKKRILEIAKVPKNYPKWESKKWRKCRRIIQNGNLGNDQSAELLIEMGKH